MQQLWYVMFVPVGCSFAAMGIARIERVMTDNAFAYRHSGERKKACANLGVKQRFIKPHCPWQNGKVERLNRTLATEWAYRQTFTSNTDLAPWFKHYSTERRYTSLRGKPPISRLRPTWWPGTPRRPNEFEPNA